MSSTFSLYLDDVLLEWLQEQSKKQDRSISYIISKILEKEKNKED